MTQSPDGGLSFRRATASDIDRVREHVQGAYRGESGRKGWTNESDMLDGQRTDKRELQELISSDNAQLWLVERGQELLGTMVLKREAAGVVHLAMVAVRPDLQAQGIGRALLAKAEQVVVEQGWGSRIEMTVIGQRSELVAWYERRGYRVTEERRDFPYGNTRFGLPMRPDLYFLVLVKDL
ncbi:MAG TPA: GNAT family N-acetyltransferase [Polyangiales bacterium]|nr:GNAT family N-acetyltransferase [Polyangiales bacterium]